MDNYNVISLTSNLSDLENDMVDWSNMSFDRRMRSDENCIRLYGMTNIDLFNNLKASIIDKKVPDNPEVLLSNIQEGTFEKSENNMIPDFNFLDDEEQTFIWKKNIANNLEQSPFIVIISPFFKDQIDMSLDELEEKYKKYYMLTPKNKRFSNSYSMDLWGYNVPNMYSFIKAKLTDVSEDNIENTDDNLISKEEKVMESVKENVLSMIDNNDKIGLYKFDIDSKSNMSNYYKSIYESIKIEKENIELDNDYSLPYVTPYFTPEEMDNITPNGILDDGLDDNYYRSISEVIKKYNESKSEEDKRLYESKILSIGWNPSVELTKENIKFARNRQIEWLKEHSANIIDITNMKLDKSVLLESSSQMRKLYKSKGLYPVYIVLSFSGTLFGKMIRIAKHSTYTHAGLSLDSDLNQIMSFKYEKESNGFHIENLDTYSDKSKDAIIQVLALFVDKATRDKLDYIIKDFISNQSKTKYSFKNIWNILIGKEQNNPENLSLVCSQFVDVVLKMANIKLTDKPSNLVIPQDFVEISNNPKIYKIYEGKVLGYKEKDVEDLIYNLFNLYQEYELKYINLTESFGTSFYLKDFYAITENESVNEILKQIRETLTPEAVIFERKSPFSFNDNGDLTINLSKSLEQQYQESHKLLLGYTEENIEGIKSELARLFFINSVIEKKIKKMKKDDPDYKSLIDLRARVLNDFKKYFKIVSGLDKDFNFEKYFQQSDYYNANIKIDNSTIKYAKSVIKNFFKAQGI
jgi:hypothetical protein